jgi:hypothetical protein
MPYISDDDPVNGIGGDIRMFEEPYHEYWFHFGRFMHAYSIAEAELLFLLSAISGLSGVKAGVMFSETGCKYARELINKLLTATKQEEKQARLKYPFDQMDVISTVRNRLVHWGASAAPDGTFTVSNVNRSPPKPKHYSVTIKDFKNMYTDLTSIYVLFLYERKEAYHPLWGKLLKWRYKPASTN